MMEEDTQTERKTLLEQKHEILNVLTENQSEKENRNNLELYKQMKKCSYYEYGNYQVNQIIYYCDACDRNNIEKICYDCYNQCHGGCGNDTYSRDDLLEEEIVHNGSQYGSFICECGKKKHSLNKTIESYNESPCMFLELDQKVHNRASYSCDSCGCQVLCFICYLKCHGTKYSCNTKKKINDNEQMNKGKMCQCSHPNHSSIIILNKYMNSLFLSRGNYDIIPFIWKSQLLNCIFDSSIYPFLFEKAFKYISTFNAPLFNENQIEDVIIDTLSRLVINVNKTEKIYSLNKTLALRFPYNNLVILMNGFSNQHLLDYSNFVSGVIQLIYIIHLKQDFQSTKALCYKNFLVSTVLDRINMRTFIFSESIYTKKIHEKYLNLVKGNRFILSKLSLDLITISRRALDQFDIKSFMKFVECYTIGFKVVYFINKRFLINKKALIKQIVLMEKFCCSFYKIIKSLSSDNSQSSTKMNTKDYINKQEQQNNESDLSITQLIFYLTKTIFVIAVNYNDFIIEEIIETKGKHKDQYFIHHEKCDSSKRLMRMVTSISIAYSSYLVKKKQLSEKEVEYINLVNRTIELFSLTDNIYFASFSTITLQDYLFYSKMQTKNKNKKKYEDSLSIVYKLMHTFSNEEIDKDEYRSITIDGKQSTFYSMIIIRIFNFKERIESLIHLFFSMAIDYAMLDTKLRSIIQEEFGEEIKHDDYNVSDISKRNKKTLGKNLNEINCKSSSVNLLQIEKINKFQKKIISNTHKELRFLNKSFYSMKDKLEGIVEELTYSSIDDSLSKVFILDPVLKSYNHSTTVLVFKILSLYCLNKGGTKYLLYSKAISRINELIAIFPLETLQFLITFSKAISLYEINVNEHKQIPILLLSIYKYIKDNIKQKEIKEIICLTMKVLFNLCDNFEIENLSKINMLIIENIKELLDKETIINLFPFHNLITNYKGQKNKNTSKQYKNNPLIISDDDTYQLDYIKSIFAKFDDSDCRMPPFQYITRKQYQSRKNNLDKIEVSSSNISNSDPSPVNNEANIKKQNTIINSLDSSAIESEEQVNDDNTTDQLKKLQNEQKFFFNLIKLLSNITYFFIMKNNTFNTIQSINDLDFYKLLLAENYLSIKQRTTLLVFIRTIYISDQIDENDSLILLKYLNSQAYSEALIDLRKLYNDETITYCNSPIEEIEAYASLNEMTSVFNRLKKQNAFVRLSNLNDLKIVIEIFIHEIKNMVYYIFFDNQMIEDVNEYVHQLIYSVKIISDVFITYDISSHMTLWFYEMTKEFLLKTNLIISFLSTIKTSLNLISLDINDSFCPAVFEMEKKTFEIYDSEKIYGFLLEALQDIYTTTDFNAYFRSSTFINNYLDLEEKNFKTFSLNKMENLFYSFSQASKSDENLKKTHSIYDISKTGKANDIPQPFKNYEEFFNIKQIYLDQFSNFYQTGFYSLLCSPTYEIEINYPTIFIRYCLEYIYNGNYFSNEGLNCILISLNRLIVNDQLQTQIVISNILRHNSSIPDESKNNRNAEKYENVLFKNLAKKLKENINVNIATCKNIFIPQRYQKINNLTKSLIQLFQLIGEGYNKNFHNFVIYGVLSHENNYFYQNNQANTIFSLLCSTLGYIIKCFNSYRNLTFKGELPFDKMMILIKNITNFISEYFQGATMEQKKAMFESLKLLFDDIKTFLLFGLIYDHKKYESRMLLFQEKRNMIFIIKIILLELISCLIEEGNADNPEFNILSDIIESFNPIDLYEEAVKSLIYINHTTPELRMHSIENKSIIPLFLEQYKYNETFQNSIDLKWGLKVFYYMKVVSEVYDRGEIKSFLDSLKQTHNKAAIEKEEKTDPPDFSSDITSLISFRIIKRNKTFTPKKYPIDKEPEEIQRELANYVAYEFLSKLLTRIEIKASDNSICKDFSFFIIPPICFLLSQQTIHYFNTFVDRDSVHSKIMNLIQETDYFIYEMFYNHYRFKSYSTISKWLSSLQIQNFEIINYLFIFLQNLFMIIHFYSLEEIDPAVKHDISVTSLVACIIHLVIIVLIMSIWFIYIFGLVYRHNCMSYYNVKFIFRSTDQKNSHFETLSSSTDALLDKITRDLTWLQKAKIIFIDSIISNRQVNMIIFTFICVVIYLITGSAIALAIPVLFLANMNELLYGIFVAVRLRWSQLLIVLCYTYLIVYIFSIFSFYFLTNSFYFEETYNVETDQLIEKEPFCSSVLQCYLSLLSYGVRSGGGIGDALIKLSFSSNVNSYLARFFFDILFHIIIILIMTNLIFGIIVDSFATLRNKTSEIFYDKMNVCFICQMTRDRAMKKNLDFDKHRETVHNLWNYVYFLTYLHINNTNNFKTLEANVWNKIYQIDTSWIPSSEKVANKTASLTELNICDLKMLFVIRKDVLLSQDKIINNTIRLGIQIMLSLTQPGVEINKRKTEMWLKQGGKNDIYYVKDYNELLDTMKKCERNQIKYNKLSEIIEAGEETTKKTFNILAIGPDDTVILKSIIGSKIGFSPE